MDLRPAPRQHEPHCRSTRCGLVPACVSALLLALLLVPSGAYAKSITEVKAELDRLKEQTRDVGNEFDRSYWRLNETEGRIAKVDKKIKRTKTELRAARKDLNEHVASVYRRGNISFIGFVMGAANFEQFVTRMEFLRRVGESDARVVVKVERLRDRFKAQRAELAAEKRSEKRALSALRSQRDRLQTRLRSKQAAFLRVKAQLDAMRGGPNRPDGQMGVPGPNGMVFPVRGSYYYSNTWGASRSGGRRRHQGTDIMAPRGTPIVAILSGTVRAGNGGLGGKTIWLSAGNGWQFYYAHLDGWAVRSGHVKAGQVIGYVGSTGNAAGGAPHLHLQIHPHGSPANPYPYLRAME